MFFFKMNLMTGQMASDDGVEGGDLQTLFGTDAQVPGPLKGISRCSGSVGSQNWYKVGPETNQ